MAKSKVSPDWADAGQSGMRGQHVAMIEPHARSLGDGVAD
jgi:hypothetical protein